MQCAKAPLAQMAGLWQLGSKSLTYSTAKLGQKPLGDGVFGDLNMILGEKETSIDGFYTQLARIPRKSRDRAPLRWRVR
jgi:hypothetical protein